MPTFHRSLPLWLPLVFLAGGCNRAAPPPTPESARPVKLAHAEERAAAIDYSASGRVEAAQRAELSFERGDVLAELDVVPGQEVREGEALARLDARNLEIAARARRARYEEARLQHERLQRLFEREAVARADVDRAQANHDSALADLEQVEKDIAASVLRAPFSGRVAATPVDRFQLVQPRQAVVVLHDLSSFRIRIDLPESFMLRAGAEANARVVARFDHLPERSFPMRVAEFATEADMDTLTYPATFEMDAPEGQPILPGMAAMLELAVPKADVLGPNCWVPEEAVFSADARRLAVWKALGDPMRVELREVEVGIVERGSMQIVSGLEVGDVVATSGVHSLVEGQRVVAYAAAGRRDRERP